MDWESKFEAIQKLKDIAQKPFKNAAQLINALIFQKDNCDLMDCRSVYGGSLDEVIKNVSNMNQNEINEFNCKICQFAQESALKVANNYLKFNSIVSIISSIPIIFQVVQAFYEIRDVSNLVEESRKLLISGGHIDSIIKEVN